MNRGLFLLQTGFLAAGAAWTTGWRSFPMAFGAETSNSPDNHRSDPGKT
jgi:hypothetical protein